MMYFLAIIMMMITLACALQVDNTCDAKQSVINGFITDTKLWPGDSSPLTIQKVTQVFSNSPLFNSGDWKLTVMCKSHQKSSLYDFFLDSESYGLIWFAFETQAVKGQVTNAAKLKKFAPLVPKRASQKVFKDFVQLMSELLLDVFPRQSSFNVPKEDEYMKLTFDSYALRGQMNSVVTSGLPINFESPEQGQRLAELLQTGFGVKLSRFQTPRDFIQSRTSSFLIPDQREQVLELATWSGYMDPKEVLGQ
ncbi:hypothetical protein MIR68_003223 [Amoeboaphelidium protococcarum]|nr:hypothetical protein MIR68_003223 [Amoeboaphelidium protococcarum]